MIPKVTAIITTFNRANFLKSAIQSVLRQTMLDLELLVLDNSSKDNTEAVVKSFNDTRIRYIKHEPMGIAAARNLGVRQAKAEFFAFLDDDDEWLENKLADQLAVFDKGDSELALVYGGFIRIDNDGSIIRNVAPKIRGNVLKELLYVDPFTGSASNPMLRKSIVEKVGYYDTDIKTGEDWELYLRIAKNYKVDFTPAYVVKVRSHQGPRLGDKLDEAAKLEIKLLEMYAEVFDGDSKLKSFYLQRIGGKLIRTGNKKQGIDYIRKAISIRPFNYIAYVQYLLAMISDKLYLKAHNHYLQKDRLKREMH